MLRMLAAASATLALCSCAYYNTFYNAQKSYEDALRSVAANPDSPSSAEAENLRKAIEGAGKVLSFYPDSRWADDAQLLVGDALLLLGSRATTGSGRSSFEEAMRAYAAAMIMTADPDIRDRASMGMGRAAAELGRYADAAASFGAVSRRDRDTYVVSRILLASAATLDGRPLEALSALDSASSLEPGDSLAGEILLSRGSALAKLGLPDSAAAVCIEAAGRFQRGNGYYRALTNAAGNLVEAGRHADAAAALQPLLVSYRSDREMASIALLSGRTREAAGDVGSALSSYRNAADLDLSREVGAEALYRRALLLESTGDLQGALADLEALADRNGEYLWVRLATDRQKDLGLLVSYTDSLDGASEDDLPVLRFLIAEKRIDLYGRDPEADSELMSLRSSRDTRVRAMALSALAGMDGTPSDSSMAYLLEARQLADSGDLASRIEEALSLPRGPGWPLRPSNVVESAWDLIGEGDFAEAWTIVDRALGSRWSADARPRLLWAAYTASEAAAMDDGLVEGYVNELAELYPATAEGRAAIARLGTSEGGDGSDDE